MMYDASGNPGDCARDPLEWSTPWSNLILQDELRKNLICSQNVCLPLSSLSVSLVFLHLLSLISRLSLALASFDLHIYTIGAKMITC